MTTLLILAASTTQSLTAEPTTQPVHGFWPGTVMDWATTVNGFVSLGTIGVLYFMYKAWNQTREQIKSAQAEAQQREKQINHRLKAIDDQAITGPFFEMLKALQSIVESSKVANGGMFEGWHAFLALYHLLQRQANPQFRRDMGPTQPDAVNRRREISDFYGAFHDNHGGSMSHYFRFLYNIVRYVDDSELSAIQKTNLIRLLRSQLSQHQLLLLFYNGLTDERGYPKFFKLIRKYNMLGNMDPRELIHPADRDIYARLPDPS